MQIAANAVEHKLDSAKEIAKNTDLQIQERVGPVVMESQEKKAIIEKDDGSLEKHLQDDRGNQIQIADSLRKPIKAKRDNRMFAQLRQTLKTFNSGDSVNPALKSNDIAKVDVVGRVAKRFNEAAALIKTLSDDAFVSKSETATIKSPSVAFIEVGQNTKSAEEIREKVVADSEERKRKRLEDKMDIERERKECIEQQNSRLSGLCGFSSAGDVDAKFRVTKTLPSLFWCPKN